MPARVGIFGGAFNPPHIGHLVCAQEAHDQLGLERVLFMPVGDAPHRELAQDPGAEARVRMCELAVAGDPRFEVSRLEVDRSGPSYTADTLRLLDGVRPVVILGADQAARLGTWHEPEVVLELADLAVAARGGVEREHVLGDLAGLAGADRIRFFDMPRLDISSSEVRARAASGRPIRYLLEEQVANYIEEKNLYPSATAVAAR